MAAVYGHRWNSAFGDAPEEADGKLTLAGDTWRRGLLGVTESQIGVGLAACVASTDPWPPTLPEFRALCLGIPSLGQVRIDVMRGERSPFTRLVWQHVDAFRLRTSDTAGAERMIREAYEIAREHVMRGGALPDAAAAALPYVPRVEPVCPVVSAAEAIASLAERFGAPGPDPVALIEEANAGVPLSDVEEGLRQHYEALAQQQVQVDTP